MRKLLLTLILPAMISGTSYAQKYVFYLHGAVVEGRGDGAVNPAYGTYHYNDIVNAFKKAHFTVISEVRKSNTEIVSYAKIISKEIDSLINKGVDAKNITVVGASKGALIAMYVSTFSKKADLNFVFLAACNDGNFSAFPDIRYYGNILSIYEKSDDIGTSCIKFKNRSGDSIRHYKEIEVNTGLSHGFLFDPLPAWFTPTVAWANGNY